ncbi:hypothetical protein LOD99_15205 [Oopsacas minuta]|uniref:Uncharacterized protein n=1 Tax=Oopsacas minuta TaxID=111878 RepID=A0AAV7KC17_9METZ|nr:hypothetical protein LOD99_15205 [Oopsacas minuta]
MVTKYRIEILTNFQGVCHCGPSPVIVYPQRNGGTSYGGEEEVTPKTAISTGIAENAASDRDTAEIPRDVEDMEANVGRYPRRKLKGKTYEDFVEWEQVPTGWRRK